MSAITCHVPAYDDPDRGDPSVPDVDYDAPRPPGSFVVSGPLTGPFNLKPRAKRMRTLTHRGYRTVGQARAWAERTYARVVADVTPDGQRDMWALLVVPKAVVA